LGFEVLERPVYSPDLAPSDYLIFGPLKNALRGRRFYADKEVQEAVHKWLRDQLKTFLKGINKLMDHWTTGPLDQVHRKGRSLCRKMTYLFRPTFV
jgi:histone-lysine N-methyltransferase SETMAR